jgi:hypothetical protein
MSSLPAEAYWTPETVCTIVYRVVMILVSLAFLYRKYRRPVRSVDGMLSRIEAIFIHPNSMLADEQLIGFLLPALRQCSPTQRNRTAPLSEHQPRPAQTLSNLVADQLDALLESAIDLGNDQIDDNCLSSSVDQLDLPTSSGTDSSYIGIAAGNTCLNCQMGVDIDLGDLGLRNSCRECEKASGDSKRRGAVRKSER